MSVIWTVDSGKLTHDELPGRITSIMCEPYPPFWWYSGSTGLTHVNLPLPQRNGAFCGCSALAKVHIPESVKSIGAYAFAETALTSVTIASDCVYSDTSFPPDCDVSRYPLSKA